MVYAEQYTAILAKTKAIKSTKTQLLENARFPTVGFVSVSSRASFVLPEVDARANLVHCPCAHLVEPAADVHMTPGRTVHELPTEFFNSTHSTTVH